MAWNHGNPFEEMERLHEEMEQLFNRLHGSEHYGRKELEHKQGKGRELQTTNFRIPLSNIYETENSVIAAFEMPGVDKKDIELNITDTHIEVKVEKTTENEDKHKGIHRYESKSSQFYRALPLPVKADSEKASAEYKDGILRIEVPKVKKIEDKKKRILIK